MALVAVGVEAANLSVKGISTQRNDKVDVYINTTTETTEGEYERFDSGMQTEPVYKIDGKYLKVDREIDKTLGIEQHCFAQLDHNKYYEPEWRKQFIIAVYRQVAGNSGAEVIVTTGLPELDDRKSSLKDDLREAFVGKTFEVNDEEFTIKELHFLGQGAAAFVNDAVIIDENGQQQPNMRFLTQTAPRDGKRDARYLYVDIGWGTVDRRPVLGTNIQKVESVSNEEPGTQGMKFIWKKVLDRAVEADKKNEWLLKYGPLGLESQFRQVCAGEDFITKDFEEVNIRKYYDEVMLEEARTIVSGMYSGSLDGKVWDQVRITGGGSIPMRPFIEQAVRERHAGNQRRIDSYKFLENPQESNCRGYLKNSQIKMRKYLENK